MALLYPNQIKNIYDATSLTIEPEENESIRIKKIGLQTVAGPGTITITVGRTVVGFFYVRDKTDQTLLTPNIQGAANQNLIEDNLLPLMTWTYPVANGEKFMITGSTQLRGYVIYDIYEAGDVKNTEVNGSKSNELNYMLYLTNAAETNTSTSEVYYKLDKKLNPVEFIDFPLTPLPEGYEAEIHHIGALAVTRGNGTANTGYTRYLRIRRERQILFDPEGKGWLVYGQPTFTANTTSYTYVFNTLPTAPTPYQRLYVFDPPLKFRPGEYMDIEQSCVGSGTAGFPANTLQVQLAIKMRKV